MHVIVRASACWFNPIPIALPNLANDLLRDSHRNYPPPQINGEPRVVIGDADVGTDESDDVAVDTDSGTGVAISCTYAGVCFACRRRVRGLPGGPMHTCHWGIVHAMLQQAMHDISSVGGAWIVDFNISLYVQ